MINIGKFNKLKVSRKTDFGYFLDAGTGNTKHDVLLHNNYLNNTKIEIDDEIEVFIYKDSSRRPTATLIKPYCEADNLAYLKVVDNTEIGCFVDLGLPKDILVPFIEKLYPLERGFKYMFYIYLDKSGRLAATTDIAEKLSTEHTYSVGDKVKGVVFGFQSNNSAMICVDNQFDGVILHNEYFTELREGDELELSVIKIYEDGKLGLSPRESRKEELDKLETQIMNYLIGADGFMRFNDKSTPDEISTVFNSSKKNFKRALGVLMKKGLIKQDSEGTYML